MSQPRPGHQPLGFSSGPFLTSLNSSPRRWGPRYLLGFIILKLNVQAVLNPNFHLDGRVQLWVRAECVDYNVHLFDDIIEAAADGGSKEIPVGDGCVIKEYSQPPQCCLNPCTKQTHWREALIVVSLCGFLFLRKFTSMDPLLRKKKKRTYLSTKFCNYSTMEFKGLPHKWLFEPILWAQSTVLNKIDFTALYSHNRLS